MKPTNALPNLYNIDIKKDRMVDLDDQRWKKRK